MTTTQALIAGIAIGFNAGVCYTALLIHWHRRRAARHDRFTVHVRNVAARETR